MIAAFLTMQLYAAAFVAAAAVPTFPVNPPAPTYGAHCPGGGGRAIGAAIGKGYYIRQELQLFTFDRDPRVVGYVYSASDGNDYIDLTPSDKSERVRLLAPGDLPRTGVRMRYCFSTAWTRHWGQTR